MTPTRSVVRIAGASAALLVWLVAILPAATARAQSGIWPGHPAPPTVSRPCTHYAAPFPLDGGSVPPGGVAARFLAKGTREEPFQVADWWPLARPGATLCLLPGVYRGKASMLRVPTGLSGTREAPLSIRALVDGSVRIDGEKERSTVVVIGSWWLLEGFDASDASGPVLLIGKPKYPERVHGITLRRLVAWRDPILDQRIEDFDPNKGRNIKVLDLVRTTDVLIEDVAAFGSGRKIASVYRSQRVIVRRGWFRWDGRWPHTKGNEFSISCMYRSPDVLCENVLATAGGSFDPRVNPASYHPGIWGIATDAAPHWEDIDELGRDRFNIGLRILGSLSYHKLGSRIGLYGGVLVGGAKPFAGFKGATLEHVAVYLDPEGGVTGKLTVCNDQPRHEWVKTDNVCSWERGTTRAQAPKILSHLSLAGGAPDRRHRIARNDWEMSDVVEIPPGSGGFDLYRGGPEGRGAKLCTRTVDGKPTAEPLWPWPMQDRIAAATAQSYWPNADVMGELRALFGDPPPECSRPPGRHLSARPSE